MTHDEMRQAAEKRFPIEPGDCRLTRMMKQKAQDAYFEKLRKLHEQENNGKLEA